MARAQGSAEEPSVAWPEASPEAAAGRRRGAASSERSEREGGGPEGMGPKEVNGRLRSPFPCPADGVRGFPPRAGSRKPNRAERGREPEGDRSEWGSAGEHTSERSERVTSCGGNVGAAGEHTSERSERVPSAPACVG